MATPVTGQKRSSPPAAAEDVKPRVNRAANARVLLLSGEKNVKLGKLDEAIEDFTKCLQGDHKNADALRERGICHCKKGDFPLAIEDFTRWLRVQPHNPDALAHRGCSHRLQGNIHSAILDYNRLLLLENPGIYRPFVLVDRSECLMRQGKHDEALRGFNEALQHQPNDVNVLEKRAECCLKMGHFDRGLADAHDCLQLDPFNPDALAIRAACLLFKDDVQRALHYAEQSLTLAPNTPLALATKADCLCRIGENLDAAIDCANRCLELKPDLFSKTLAISVIGASSLKRGHDDVADCLTLSADRAVREKALLLRGEFYIKKDLFGEAIKDFTSVLKDSPNHVFALSQRGFCYLQKEDIQSALKDLNACLMHDPNCAFALQLRGECHQKNNQPELALVDYLLCLKLQPNNSFVLLRRGRLYQQRNEFDLAISDLTRALALELNDLDRVSAYFYRSVCYSAKHLYLEAFEDASRAKSLSRDDKTIQLCSQMIAAIEAEVQKRFT